MNPRRTSIWMGPWDLVGRDPSAVLGELEEVGVAAISLAFAYHGGRLLLGNHPSRLVTELHRSAIYFAAELAALAPLPVQRAPESTLTSEFIEAAARRGFAVEGWLVLCHNDWLAEAEPSLAITNAFGEPYTYALCPANPRVRAYCVELCRQAARTEGVGGLDLEALSFMGYEHASLHDKRGTTLPAEAAALLSVCLCPSCRAALGSAAVDLERQIQACVRAALRGEHAAALPPELEAALLEHRARVQRQLLREIREATGAVRLNLRWTPDRRFTGGKCSLPADALAGLTEEATVTFFGFSLDRIREAVARLPDCPVPMRAGFVFHGPDCCSPEDVQDRADALRVPVVQGLSLYSYSLAAPRHLDWARRALDRRRKS